MFGRPDSVEAERLGEIAQGNGEFDHIGVMIARGA